MSGTNDTVGSEQSGELSPVSRLTRLHSRIPEGKPDTAEKKTRVQSLLAAALAKKAKKTASEQGAQDIASAGSQSGTIKILTRAQVEARQRSKSPESVVLSPSEDSEIDLSPIRRTLRLRKQTQKKRRLNKGR